MGINERKERERDAVKDLILSAAREIFLAEGYENTSIRKIATKIEYSPGIIYNHFKDKNDLLLALHDKAFECKIEALFLSVQNMPDPLTLFSNSFKIQRGINALLLRKFCGWILAVGVSRPLSPSN